MPLSSPVTSQFSMPDNWSVDICHMGRCQVNMKALLIRLMLHVTDSCWKTDMVSGLVSRTKGRDLLRQELSLISSGMDGQAEGRALHWQEIPWHPKRDSCNSAYPAKQAASSPSCRQKRQINRHTDRQTLTTQLSTCSMIATSCCGGGRAHML